MKTAVVSLAMLSGARQAAEMTTRQYSARQSDRAERPQEEGGLPGGHAAVQAMVEIDGKLMEMVFITNNLE